MLTSLQQFDDRLLPKRFLYMGEEGPSESFGPDEGTGGVSEAAAEAAAEERRQTAAAAKKQRKQEKKAKKREGKLADIIRMYINGPQADDHMASLLSKLLQRNVPAPIILSVMSLNYSEVVEVLENYLEEEQEVIPDDLPSSDSSAAPAIQSTELVQYGKELAQSLSEWTKRVFLHSSFHPMKTIVTLAHAHGVDENMLELTTKMIQKYFREVGQEVPLENIRQFSEFYWRDALRRLHKLADERGLLPDPTQDPSFDEDDEDDEDEDDD